MGAMGDYHFYDYPNTNGCLHSWSYSYIRDKKGTFWLASLNEAAGFSLIEHNTNLGTITISSEKMELEHSYPALDLFIGFKNPFENTAYFTPRLSKESIKIGWTSWYNHYTNINETIIQQAATNFATFKTQTQFADTTSIQIDDGWQIAVGDWLKPKNTFSKGMEAIADDIRSKGSSPGLWLAPFICESKSDIFKNKKEWLLQDTAGKPVLAGYNPLWSGRFYALDFYNDEVQNYLRLVLQTAVLRWGFRLLKLDFLYAACLFPPKNKTRGQVMHDVMAFLTGIIQPHAQILACGIPLAAAFGKVEYCRIGADTHLSWEHFWLRLVRNRERVSTQLALRNTLGRSHLNGHVFSSDPDVFILRNNNNHLTTAQRQTLLTLNILLGSVWFSSDDIASFSPELRSQFETQTWLYSRKIQRIEMGDDCCLIHFTVDNCAFTAYSNLSNSQKMLKKISLKPFETIVKIK